MMLVIAQIFLLFLIAFNFLLWAGFGSVRTATIYSV
ncbi:hypothetical protein AAEX37_01725 [Oligella sp. MSHR50489EDL]